MPPFDLIPTPAGQANDHSDLVAMGHAQKLLQIIQVTRGYARLARDLGVGEHLCDGEEDFDRVEPQPFQCRQRALIALSIINTGPEQVQVALFIQDKVHAERDEGRLGNAGFEAPLVARRADQFVVRLREGGEHHH